MEKLDLFPCPLWQFDIPVFFEVKDQLIKEIYSIKKQYVGDVTTSVGGWQSNSLFALESEKEYRSNSLKIIINKIIKPIENNLLSYGHIVIISEMWYNINGKNCSNEFHDHPGVDLAGIFYVKVPDRAEKSGDLILRDPHCHQQFKLNRSITPDEPVKTYSITPKEGKFIMFPGHLLHKVETNKTDEDRISIAFNLTIRNTND